MSSVFPRHRGRPPIHPWDEWGDGADHRLRQGVDFQSKMKSFQVLVHRTAASRGMKANTLIVGKTMIIRFY